MVFYKTDRHIFGIEGGLCASVLDLETCRYCLIMKGYRLLGGSSTLDGELIAPEKIEKGMRLKFQHGQSVLCTSPVLAILTDTGTGSEASLRIAAVTLPETELQETAKD